MGKKQWFGGSWQVQHCRLRSFMLVLNSNWQSATLKRHFKRSIVCLESYRVKRVEVRLRFNILKCALLNKLDLLRGLCKNARGHLGKLYILESRSHYKSKNAHFVNVALVELSIPRVFVGNA